MKILLRLALSVSLLSLSLELPAFENLPVSGNMPDVVNLRTDCSSTNPDLKNCADNVGELLTWIWNTRQPTDATPLSVEIGPGNFPVPVGFFCDGLNDPGRGHVSFNGSGRDVTAFVPSDVFVANVLAIQDCDSIAFQDMAFNGDYNALAVAAVIKWTGGGSSTWTNIDVSGTSQYLWDEKGSASGDNAIHYWFGAKFHHISVGSYGAAYSGKAGESWIYNSDILSTDGGGGHAVGVYVSGGDVRIFGSTVRAVVPPGSTVSALLPTADTLGNIVGGLLANNSGQIHMHGGIVAVRALGTGNVNIFGAMGNGTTTIHTPDTAYVGLASGTGTSYVRTAKSGNANVAAPFQWPSSASPPAALISIDGADSFVETDCGTSGNCNGGGSFPHMMIYSSSCDAGNPWFDTAVNACRQ